LPFTTLVSYILNLIRRSLQFELNSFAGFLNFPDVSKQAFSQARIKLSPLVFQLLNKKLLVEFYSDNEIKLFKGLRLLAIDGSTVRLPPSEELFHAFKVHTERNNVPVALTSVMYDVLNHMTLHATLASYYDASEKSMAVEHLEALQALDTELSNVNFQDLCIFDRGYPSRFLMLLLRNHRKHFLFRVPETSTFGEVCDAVKAGFRDAVINIAVNKDMFRRPNEKEYFSRSENKELKVRILVFDLSSGEKEVVVTSLIDQKEFTYEDIFKLYSLRWNVEEHYKFYKCIAEIENFSGESKIAVEQDFYATVFTCNSASLLAQEAQEEVNQAAASKETKYTYKINRNILIGTVKNEILEVLLGEQDLTAYCEKLKRRLKRSLVAVRPGRSFERPQSRRERRPVIHKNTI
jgi:hypothetical protein